MIGNFPACLAITRKWEGGDVNHPKDPGGLTSRGVTQARGAAYRKKRRLSYKSVTEWTDGEVDEFYRLEFWYPVRGDQLPAGVDLSTWDYGVNSGTSRSVKKLQKVVGVAQDGKIGTITLDAIAARDPAAIVVAHCDARLTFLRGLSIWSTFGKGWARRVADIRSEALKMAGLNKTDMKDVAREDEVKARVEDAKTGGAVVGGASSTAGGISDSTPAMDMPLWMTVAFYGVGALLLLLAVYFVGRAIAHRLNADAAIAAAQE